MINPQLPAQRHQPLEERQVHALRRGFAGKFRISSFGRGCIRGSSCSSSSSIASAVPSSHSECSAPSIPRSPARRCESDSSDSAPPPCPRRPASPGTDARFPPSIRSSRSPPSPDRGPRHIAACTSCKWPCAAAERRATANSGASPSVCAASISLSTMCFGVAPSGFPIPKSMMSSPRLRAAAFNSLVMLNTYAGSRVSLLKFFHSCLPAPVCLFLHDATTPSQSRQTYRAY